jgi:uncharacterized repeat protein (TIGR01451 family)
MTARKIFGVIVVCILGVILWTAVVGVYVAMAQSVVDAPPDNGTIPPVKPFEKQAFSAFGGQGRAYSNELVTYTVVIRQIITDSYYAEVGVTDTLPSSLVVESQSITASAGQAVLTDGVITWTLTVETGSEPYTLTYAARASSTVTNELTIANTAYLWERKNLGDPARPATREVLSTTASLVVRPRNLHLPFIRLDPTPTPTPTPAPAPLPMLANHNFEQGQVGWNEVVQPVPGTPRPGKLIYSITENPLIGVQGNYYAWLGGARNQINELSQRVRLPIGYSDLRLRFRYRVYSQETNCSNDRVEVRINGTPVAVTPEAGSQHQLCVPFVPVFKSAVTGNLATHSGNEVDVSFWTQLNDTLNSNYFLDVVELCSDQPGAPQGTRSCSLP